MSNKKEIIIKATKLKKSFITGDIEQVIFENLNLNIYKGDFTVIMGSSGAGKSTLMYALSGMDRPTSGEIVWNDKEITALNDDKMAVFRRKNCGFVFQQIYLLDKMSLIDNVLTASALSEMSKKESVKYATELFDLVNISEITRKKFPSQVSGGEAQRAAIVRAVINKPEVLFADEPTGNLDPKNSLEVMQILEQINQRGITVIVSTHDYTLVDRFRKRVLTLENGEIVRDIQAGTYGH